MKELQSIPISTVKSAERTMDVLSFLGRHSTPVPAGAIQRNLDLPRSSTFTLLNAMRRRGYLVHYEKERRWGLGPMALTFGASHTIRGNLARLGRPSLHRLATSTGETSLLVIRSEHEIEVIARTDPGGRSTRAAIPAVGWRISAHLSAYGRALLLQEPEARVRAIFGSDQVLATPHRRGPRDRGELLQLLRQQRSGGYGWDHGEVDRMSGSVAAPVFDHLDRPIAAIGCTYWSGSHSSTGRSELARSVREVAAAFSRSLGVSTW